MFDNQTMWRVNQERHSELLKLAQAERLVEKSKAKRAAVKDRPFMNVGDLVASLATKLKAQQESVTR